MPHGALYTQVRQYHVKPRTVNNLLIALQKRMYARRNNGGYTPLCLASNYSSLSGLHIAFEASPAWLHGRMKLGIVQAMQISYLSRLFRRTHANPAL